MNLSPDLLRRAKPLLDKQAMHANAEDVLPSATRFLITVSGFPLTTETVTTPVEIEEGSPNFEAAKQIFRDELARDKADVAAALAALGAAL